MSARDQAWTEGYQQETGEQFRQLFEDAPVAYHELNMQGVVQRVNHAECKMLEYSPEEMIGKHICDFAAPQDAEKCRNAFAFKITGKKQAGVPFIRAYRTKSNREIMLEIHDQLMRDPEGQIIGIRSALIDVTDRLEAESSFRSAHRLLDRVFYAVDKAVLVLDGEGLVKFVNPQAEKLLGWAAKDIVGFSLAEQFPATFSPDPKYPPYSLQTVLTHPWQGGITFLTGLEEKQEARIITAPIFAEDKECLGAVMVLRPWHRAPAQGGQEE